MHDETAGNGQQINLDGELQRQISEFARAQGTTPSDVVRTAFDALRRSSQRRPETSATGESLLERWTRLGFVGAVDDPDLPFDLSTNKKHMEGFGRD